MKISKNSWHVRVYRWWYEQKHGHEFEKVTTNLCPYVRVVLFYALLRWIFITKKWRIITSWTALGLVLEYLGYRIFGHVFLLGELCILEVLFLSGALMGAGLGTGYLIKKKLKKPANPNSFGRVLKAYARSFHDRICPFITVE